MLDVYAVASILVYNFMIILPIFKCVSTYKGISIFKYKWKYLFQSRKYT